MSRRGLRARVEEEEEEDLEEGEDLEEEEEEEGIALNANVVSTTLPSSSVSQRDQRNVQRQRQQQQQQQQQEQRPMEMDRSVRMRVDAIFNSLIENVSDEHRAGIASYIAKLARDTANENNPRTTERLDECVANIRGGGDAGVGAGAASRLQFGRISKSDVNSGGDLVTATTTTTMATMNEKKKKEITKQHREPSWKEYASEEKLRDFLRANDVSGEGDREELLSKCTKFLAKVSEPAGKIGDALKKVLDRFEKWANAVGKKNANEAFSGKFASKEEEEVEEKVKEIDQKKEKQIVLDSDDKLGKATAILREIQACECESRAHVDWIQNNADPFKIMQYPEQGCSILDIPYIHIDFSIRVIHGLFPILKTAVAGSSASLKEVGGMFFEIGQKERYFRKGQKSWHDLGMDLCEVSGQCIDLVFGIIGTSLNESNLTNPVKATKFLVELCTLRDEWRVASKNSLTPELPLEFIELLGSNDARLGKLYAAGEREDVDDEEKRRQVIQLPPHALTQLHESFHGPTRPNSEYRVPQELTWECLWESPKKLANIVENATTIFNDGSDSEEEIEGGGDDEDNALPSSISAMLGTMVDDEEEGWRTGVSPDRNRNGLLNQVLRVRPATEISRQMNANANALYNHMAADADDSPALNAARMRAHYNHMAADADESPGLNAARMRAQELAQSITMISRRRNLQLQLQDGRDLAMDNDSNMAWIHDDDGPSSSFIREQLAQQPQHLRGAYLEGMRQTAERFAQGNNNPPLPNLQQTSTGGRGLRTSLSRQETTSNIERIRNSFDNTRRNANLRIQARGGISIEQLQFMEATRRLQSTQGMHAIPNNNRMGIDRASGENRNMLRREWMDRRGMMGNQPGSRFHFRHASEENEDEDNNPGELANVSHTVTNLVRRLRAIGPPPDGRWKSRSPMFIRLIEHIVRWELLGNSTFITPDFYPQKFPVADKLGKLIPKSGRWMVVLVRGMGLHCVPMLHCILHGLRSDNPKMRDIEGHPGAIFCAGSAACVRIALESIIENNGEPPTVLANEYWKTLAHVGECLMSWCIGAKRYLHEIQEDSLVSDKKMRSRVLARKATLAGLAGPDIKNWGIAVAKGAPLMLSALAKTETVSQQTMDGVSGVLYLLSRLISKEAETDPRWRNARKLAKTATLPKELVSSVLECQKWATEVASAIYQTMSGENPIDALIEKTATESENKITDTTNNSTGNNIKKRVVSEKGEFTPRSSPPQHFDFRDPRNTRKGIRLGFLVALVATWSYGKAGFIDAKYLDKYIEDASEFDNNTSREKNQRRKNNAGSSVMTTMSPVSTSIINSKDGMMASTRIFKIIHAALDKCSDGLLSAIEPLARIGWSLNGENSGIRGVLQQIGQSRFLGEFAGEFPVHSPSQQLVDMIQLLLHAGVELRSVSDNESRRDVLANLLTQQNWKRSFSCLECIAPNMFYFGSSLDLVGAADVVFPPSFRANRLKNDIKRLARDIHGNVPQITAKLRRSKPADDAWVAIKNSLGPMLGRTFACSFVGEDGVGNGVVREAWTVLIKALLEGHPLRPGQNEALFTSWSQTPNRPDSRMSLSAVVGRDGDNPSFEGALHTIRPDCSPHAARFAGRIVGLLVSNEKTADLPLVPWLWQSLLHKPLKAELLAQVDDDFKRTLLPLKTCDWNDPKIRWIKDDPPSFTIAAPTRTDPNNIKELVPNGSKIYVNEWNRESYVDLYARNCMLRCGENGDDITLNLEAFASGFDEVIPRELLGSWECDDLELLICGMQDINVGEWKKATLYEPNQNQECAQAKWFWEAVHSMNTEKKHSLLHFWTAFRKLPHTGFHGLRFKLRFDDQMSPKHLPMAQTCFLTLRVPKYKSFEETKARLETAISECCFGFGFS